jgi:hypothetical protein
VKLDEGGYWSLDLPWEGHESEHNRFDDWHENGCAHFRMQAADERVANLSGLASFLQALAAAGGATRFPVLQIALPTSNDGQCSPATAAAMGLELEFFKAMPSLGQTTWLIDSETGGTIFEHIEVYDGIFMLDGSSGVSMGVDGEGFFVIDRRSGAEVFRSRKFEQLLLDPVETDNHRKGRVVLTDLARGASWSGTCAVSGRQIAWPDGRMQNDAGKLRFHHPTRFHTELRSRAAADFSYIVDPLLRLCHAASETGNPIRWA